MFDQYAIRKNTDCIKWDGNVGTIPFGIADSDYPVAKPILDAMQERLSKAAFGYTFFGEEYYKAVIGWIDRHYGYKVSKEMLTPANGIVYAINFLVQTLTSPTDKIVIQRPVYNMFEVVLNRNKREIIDNQLIFDGNTFHIDFDDLEKCLQQAKMLILCSPHNPCGCVWSASDIEKIVYLCKKYDVILVSDEIHADLILFDNVFTSVGKFLDKFNKIVICTAPSKTFNLAGFFSSSLVFNNTQFKQKFLDMMALTCTDHPSIFGQVATIAAYTEGDSWAEQQNRYLEKNYIFMKNFFRDQIPQSTVVDLQGTYLAFVDLSFLNKSEKQMDKIFRENGVSVNFGSAYGANYAGWIRLNLACPLVQLQDGLNKILQSIVQLQY